MNKIITSSELQKEIGQISKQIGDLTYIVTVHGKGRMVVLPYFEGCDQLMQDYMEDFEMMQNRDKLQKRYKESSDSGAGSLSV